MKKILPVVAFLAIIYLIVSAIKNIWNPLQWFSMGSSVPANGTACTDSSGVAGVYTNGVCTTSGGPGNGNGDGNPEAGRMGSAYIYPYKVSGRRVKIFPKPAGTSCNARIWDSTFGWGLYYPALSTSTSCAYIF